ncbi:hypothetical protein CHELA1G11_20925 [Hyphomicrobiales bacterium]|nr:hypothetical protein CHELA1G11_20925 [Hyphomicrobiales bacterium]CAH1692613.1 hypothetical protein CHELA1G2_21240 [Hyphomicrobiales bacterium]
MAQECCAPRLARVGGATEVEVKEKKDRVDDALNATRAAVEEGILPGGGGALLRAVKALQGLVPGNDDQRTGVEIVGKAITAPAGQIVDNAGDDGAVVIETMAGQRITSLDPIMPVPPTTTIFIRPLLDILAPRPEACHSSNGARSTKSTDDGAR